MGICNLLLKKSFSKCPAVTHSLVIEKVALGWVPNANISLH